ncbi:hypothetical protein GTCCBUS3UF5_3810 [Geobacillus thermoleovorans CCB_US3_UF5]|uniref:Transposase n=1 Tax=Geobacillus thermoleovorans CCB_US3_UF5 TaxID=1111068 RepID=A0ABM5MDG0_GEOTH|nr:hypothetical protein GTCCBUS3UF5_3810 [Geobacillus thermoleovorans CCB_US3_UF5]
MEAIPYYNHNKLKKIIKNIYQYIRKILEFRSILNVKKELFSFTLTAW